MNKILRKCLSPCSSF